MTVLEELTREFGGAAAVASAIIESLLDNGFKIRTGTIGERNHGFTGAQLAKAQVANVTGPPDPRWCMIKFCPSAASKHQRENRRHLAALGDATAEFRRQHLVEIAFPTVDCPQDAFVVGQFVADGIPLGKVDPDQLAGACKTIWRRMLLGWTGVGYDSDPGTVAGLLTCELGDGFTTDGWLHDWARKRGLLTPDLLELPGESEPLPNPWRLFTRDTPATRRKIHYLLGRTHGDLHGDNVLVPTRNGIVDAKHFRLIDLATYDARAPLSRDLATLLISLSWREIGKSSSYSQETFLTYLERDRRDKRLDDGMPGGVRKIIDALREPTLQFVVDKHGDPEQWHMQLKVSLLAQAMLHSTYESGTADARRWCARLAGRLTRVLLGPVAPQAARPEFFDAGDVSGTTSTMAAQTASRPARGTSAFVDRAGPQSRLRAALDDRTTSVIVVSGPAGIGKTALVREVLADLGRADPDDESSAVRWHDATPYGEIDVATLIEDIEPPGLGHAAGPSARARLEIALDGLDATGGFRPVIVIDSAENLLKDGHVLRDSELDLALGTIQGRPNLPVKIVFVTQHMPEATAGVAWAEKAVHISLSGLNRQWLRKHFAVLDPSDAYGLAVLPKNDLRRVHGRLAGNPRLAELLSAVISSELSGLQVHEIGSWLSSVPASEVHQRLVHKFVDHLPAEQQRVAEGLAALGIPAGTDDVVGILESYVPPSRIEPALRALVAAGLVLVRRDGRWYLRKSEIEAVLNRLAAGDRRADEGEPPTRRALLLRAAKVLEGMQKDDDNVHGMADLHAHFARIDVWLRAGLYDCAHGLIESMDDLVHRWGSGTELRTQREAVRGRLGDDPEGEMVNLAGLGDIYSYSGDFPAAHSAYRFALDMAQQDQNREAIRGIHIGMGVMFWEHGHLAEAEKHFGSAWGLAGEDDDDGDRAAALTGLADCRQRQGSYRHAIQDALAAFEAAQESDPELASGAALRLVRWYAELNAIPDALTMLARCDELVTARPDPSLQADLLSATAELYLYQDRYSEARWTVERAIGIARDHRDPINLRRSLTVLALTHVHMGDLRAARKAIEESARYRVAGQEVVELALRGIIAHRLGLPGTARDLFQQLHDETGQRTRADAHDLVAWDFTGIARCYSVLVDHVDPATALAAFRRARPEPAERTPGLDDRLRFMVEILANGDPRLEPVLIQLARMRPGRAG